MRTCILTWIAGNILRTFNDRMDLRAVSNTGEPLDLFIFHKAIFQQIKRNGNPFLRFFYDFAPVLWSKHSLSQSIQSFIQ